MPIEEDPLSPVLTALEESADGLIYVEDGENGMYEIEAFLGDASPICQVFKAIYSPGTKIGKRSDAAGASCSSRRRSEFHLVVTLKLARIDASAEFINLRREVDDSFRTGRNNYLPNYDYVVTGHVILGFYKFFDYRNLLCISLPYMEGGSLRYNMVQRTPNLRLPEEYIALVLRQILGGLLFLHSRGRVHQKLNAGNIFIGGIRDPYDAKMKMKLGYQGTTYFHDPQSDGNIRIWDDSWDPSLGPSSLCVASKLEVNRFWTIRGIYEPSRRGIQKYTDKSDIWNLGVMALELALGPFRFKRDMLTDLRKPEEFHSFLTELCSNEEIKMPELSELFLVDPTSRNSEADVESEKGSIDAARKMKSGMLNAGRKVKNFLKKASVKKRLPKESSGQGPEEPAPDIEVELSNSFKAMVKRCLVIDPEARPTAEELLADPFFEEHRHAHMQQFKYYIQSYLTRDLPPSPDNQV